MGQVKEGKDMTKINAYQFDKTLTAIKDIIEKSQIEKQRKYLGMSIIGRQCPRNLFYYYRQCAKIIIPIKNLLAIEDGYRQEDLMADRLRLLPGITLITEQDGKQIEFSDCDGHFCGHADGMIKGILEAPETWHVWEHKSVNEDKFNKLVNLRDELGEKSALEKWDPEYYAQAQSYMNKANVDRHFLTVSKPGGRDFISIRTELKKTEAKEIIKKAQSIIFDNWTAPARISDKREFYLCKWCDYQGICHDGDFPLVNCRTCRYNEPRENGTFYCLRKQNTVESFEPCAYHIYNPALIASELVKHTDDGVVYNHHGIKWGNFEYAGFPTDESISTFYSSKELFKLGNINAIMPEKKAEKTTRKAWDNRLK